MKRPMSPKIKFTENEKIAQVNSETKKLWDKYEIDMSIRELSRGTIEGYHNDLTHLWIYTLEHFDNVPITELSEDELTEFFYYCKTQGNNTRRIRRRMASVSAFYKFLRKKRLIKEDPTEFIDRPKKDTSVITQTFLTKEQVSRMKQTLRLRIDEAKTIPNHHLMISYLCYATISLSTMARVNAIGSIMWDQIDFDNRVINDVLEKEGKIVSLYFSEEVSKNLKELIKFREDNGIDDGGYVFVAKDRGEYHKVSNGTLSQWSKKIGAMIGVQSLHPHDFRNSQATLFKDAGMPLEDISSLLNHESTETTNQFYIKKNDTKVVSLKDRFEVDE